MLCLLCQVLLMLCLLCQLLLMVGLLCQLAAHDHGCIAIMQCGAVCLTWHSVYAAEQLVSATCHENTKQTNTWKQVTAPCSPYGVQLLLRMLLAWLCGADKVVCVYFAGASRVPPRHC